MAQENNYFVPISRIDVPGVGLVDVPPKPERADGQVYGGFELRVGDEPPVRVPKDARSSRAQVRQGPEGVLYRFYHNAAGAIVFEVKRGFSTQLNANYAGVAAMVVELPDRAGHVAAFGVPYYVDAPVPPGAQPAAKKQADNTKEKLGVDRAKTRTVKSGGFTVRVARGIALQDPSGKGQTTYNFF